MKYQKSCFLIEAWSRVVYLADIYLVMKDLVTKACLLFYPNTVGVARL